MVRLVKHRALSRKQLGVTAVAQSPSVAGELLLAAQPPPLKKRGKGFQNIYSIPLMLCLC